MNYGHDYGLYTSFTDIDTDRCSQICISNI